MSKFDDPDKREMMRKLIYAPVIHMKADMGSVAEQINKRGIIGFGEEFWEKHRQAVSGFWDSISDYFHSLEIEGFKIYQDGLVADGEVGDKIVEEGIKTGSKNYEIIGYLMEKGGVLVQTEDFSLVKKERDCIVKISNAKSVAAKLTGYFMYRLIRNKLLKKRDDYIAKKILSTLDHGELGILFMGAYHNVAPFLSKKTQLIEIKDVEKIREYQRLLLCHNRDNKKFESLAKYLTAPVEVTI